MLGMKEAAICCPSKCVYVGAVNRRVATSTHSTQLRTHCQRRGHFKILQSVIKTGLMTLVYLQQVKSNRTKLIDFISDDDCD